VRVLGHLVGMELADGIVGGGGGRWSFSSVRRNASERDDQHFGMDVPPPPPLLLWAGLGLGRA
jgi:hypothetical protein